jgi:hypothetical protein
MLSLIEKMLFYGRPYFHFSPFSMVLSSKSLGPPAQSH